MKKTLLMAAIVGITIVGCDKIQKDDVKQNESGSELKLTIGGGGSGSCFNQECPCTGDGCNDFGCATIRTGGTDDVRKACRKPGNQPLPHYVYVGVDGLTPSDVAHHHFDLFRTHSSGTVQIVNDGPNHIVSGRSELLWLDDGLPAGWATDWVNYEVKFYNSSDVLISSYTVGEFVN